MTNSEALSGSQNADVPSRISRYISLCGAWRGAGALVAGGALVLGLAACGGGGGVALDNGGGSSSQSSAVSSHPSGGSGAGQSSGSAAVPSWVTPNLTVRYVSAVASGYTSVRYTTTVESVSSKGVAGETATLGVGTDRTYNWSCSATGDCPNGAAGFQFWVDPADPTASVKGQGLPFENVTLAGVTDVENGVTYNNVGALTVSNAAQTRSYTIVYDRSSGLVIETKTVDGITTQLWYDSGAPVS